MAGLVSTGHGWLDTEQEHRAHVVGHWTRAGHARVAQGRGLGSTVMGAFGHWDTGVHRSSNTVVIYIVFFYENVKLNNRNG